MKSNYKKYSKTLPLAYKIHALILPQPTTHQEWADRFNKVGAINKIIQTEVTKDK